MWVNSTQPYRKSIELTDTPLSIPFSRTTWYSLTSRSPSSLPKTHMTMNGLLNGYSASAVASPSLCPLMTFGNGKESYPGFAYTSPYMACRAVGTAASPAGPCVFNPTGAPQAGVTGITRGDTYEFAFNPANDTTWTHGNGLLVAATDSSAHFYPQPKSGTNSGNRNQPGYIYTAMGQGKVAIEGGYVDTPARCVASAGATPYLSFYRPDNTGNFTVGSAGQAVPCNN